MALTYAEVGNPTYGRSYLPPFELYPLDITFDSSYATGGETIGGGTTGITSGNIIGVEIVGGNAASAGYNARYLTSTNKLAVYTRAAGSVYSYAPGGGDLKGATNPAGTEGNADQAAAPVNSTLLMSADTFTNFAGTMTVTTQPDVPRNVMITIFNDSGGSLNLYEGITTFTITGTDILGAAQTETVTLTSTAGNKAVANTPKYRYVQGVKAFATVTTVTYDNAPAGGLKASLGVGTRIGLPVALQTATYTDVKDITVSAVRVAPSATATAAGGVDTTNNCINTDTTADGFDLGVVYAAASVEVASGVNLSAVTFRGIIWTRLPL